MSYYDVFATLSSLIFWKSIGFLLSVLYYYRYQLCLSVSRRICNVITTSRFDFFNMYMVFFTLKYTLARSRNDLWVHINNSFSSRVQPSTQLKSRGLTVGPYFHIHLFRESRWHDPNSQQNILLNREAIIFKRRIIFIRNSN